MTARLIEKPTVIKAAGNPPKEIQEFIGRVNTGTAEASIAKMISPAGWAEARLGWRPWWRRCGPRAGRPGPAV